MVGHCSGAVVDGISGTVVGVEADVGRGLPQFSIVGLPDSAVRESKLRIRSAVRNAGMEFPNRRITVNLSPASLRKRGAGLDLAIAVSILRAAGQLPADNEHRLGFAAELGLSGQLIPVPGIVTLALALRDQGITAIVVSADQTGRDVAVPNVEWIPCECLQDVIAFLRSGHRKAVSCAEETLSFALDEAVGDFTDVRGLSDVKRALTIAAAGGHHTLLVGPPGSGKTWIAERFNGILPLLQAVEALEVYAIHQACTGVSRNTATPPLRIPHHTLSPAGMVGGGGRPLPGEVTLAHRGVLLLDEVLEFPRATLDALREPLVHKEVRLSRSGISTVYPADFILLGTLNPCPCGQRGFGDCTCHPSAVTRYWQRLSGAMLDRVELLIPVQRTAWVAPSAHRESSSEIRTRVERARCQLAQTKNSCTEDTAKPRRGHFHAAAIAMLNQAMEALSLSARAVASVQSVATTIAALDDSEIVTETHLGEALSLRGPATRSSFA